MRHLLISLCAVVLSGVVFAAPVKFQTPDGKYSAKFPDPPQAMGTIYTSMTGNTSCQINISHVGNVQADFLGMVRKRAKAEGETATPVKAGRYEGVEVVHKMPSGGVNIERTFVIGQDLVIVSVSSFGGPPKGDAARFLDSFRAR